MRLDFKVINFHPHHLSIDYKRQPDGILYEEEWWKARLDKMSPKEIKNMERYRAIYAVKRANHIHKHRPRKGSTEAKWWKAYMKSKGYTGYDSMLLQTDDDAKIKGNYFKGGIPKKIGQDKRKRLKKKQQL